MTSSGANYRRVVSASLLIAVGGCGGGGGGPLAPSAVPPSANGPAPVTLADLPTVAQVGSAEITAGSPAFGDHTLSLTAQITEVSGRQWTVNSIRFEAAPNEGGMASPPSIAPRSSGSYASKVYFRDGSFNKSRLIYDFITDGKAGYKVVLVLTDLKEPKATKPSPPPPPPSGGFCSSFACYTPGKDTCNCGDLGAQAQKFHDQCDPQDVNRLDQDNDGLACE